MDRSAQFAAILVLSLASAGCGDWSRPDPAALIEKLKSPDQAVSGPASLALIKLGEPAVPALIELLKDPDPRHRHLATVTFWGLGERGGGAAEALAQALTGDSDPAVRVGAAMALANMGPPAAPAVSALVKALRDPSVDVRPWAARALGSIGAAAEPAVPALEQAAKLDGVHGPAEEAIRKIRAR